MIDHSTNLTLHERASSSKTKEEKTLINVKRAKSIKNIKCFLYKESGHLKNNCLKQKVWFKKKSTYFISLYFKSNLTNVPNKTWWLNSDAITYIFKSPQGFLSIQSVNINEKFLYMGNRMNVRIEEIRTYRLILNTGYCVDLKKCLYAPDCACNLVFIGKLDELGFSFKIGQNLFSLYQHNYGSGTLFISFQF